jgi:Tfp pilus assembly protein PilF
LDPTNTAARNNRALCSLQQSNWKAAVEDTSRVLDAEPNNAKVTRDDDDIRVWIE